MSEIKRLGENISYLDRFMTDIKAIKSNIESNHNSRSYEEACEDIFNNVRSYSIEEITRLKDVNIEIAQAVQVFSNQTLKLISTLMSNEMERHKSNQTKLDLMKDIISTTESSRYELSSQIENAKVRDAVEVPEPPISQPPPVRRSNTGKQIRKVGDRPKHVSKPQSDS